MRQYSSVMSFLNKTAICARFFWSVKLLLMMDLGLNTARLIVIADSSIIDDLIYQYMNLTSPAQTEEGERTITMYVFRKCHAQLSDFILLILYSRCDETNRGSRQCLSLLQGYGILSRSPNVHRYSNAKYSEDSDRTS